MSQLHLVSEIISSQGNDKEIWGKIRENFQKYKNIPLDEIDLEHVWIKTSDKLIYDYRYYGKHFVILEVYRCIKTGSLGFTFSYKNMYIIKPFKVIKHNWKRRFDFNENIKAYPKNVGYNYAYFKCKDCEIHGLKKMGTQKDEIFPYKNQLNLETIINYSLTCDEYLISNIII